MHRGLLSSLDTLFMRVSTELIIERAPALMDNLFLTLVAPDFAILEWLALLGYKENEIGEAMDLIHERIRLFHAAKND